jgi:hypothetical protein
MFSSHSIQIVLQLYYMQNYNFFSHYTIQVFNAQWEDEKENKAREEIAKVIKVNSSFL